MRTIQDKNKWVEEMLMPSGYVINPGGKSGTANVTNGVIAW